MSGEHTLTGAEVDEFVETLIEGFVDKGLGEIVAWISKYCLGKKDPKTRLVAVLNALDGIFAQPYRYAGEVLRTMKKLEIGDKHIEKYDDEEKELNSKRISDVEFCDEGDEVRGIAAISLKKQEADLAKVKESVEKMIYVVRKHFGLEDMNYRITKDYR